MWSLPHRTNGYKCSGLVIHDGQCGVRDIQWILQVVICGSLLVFRPCLRTSDIPPGAGAANLTLVVRPDDVPQVGRMETVQPSTPLDSGRMSPDSPQTVAFDDMANSSVLLSLNRVQVGRSQDVRGSLD